MFKKLDTPTPGITRLRDHGGRGRWVDRSLRGAAAAAPAWAPSDLASLGAWYDASDPSSLTLAGANVSAWADKSGHGNHLASTGGIDPVYSATSFNSLPGVTFGFLRSFSNNALAGFATNQISFAMAIQSGADHASYAMDYFNFSADGTSRQDALQDYTGTLQLRSNNTGVVSFASDTNIHVFSGNCAQTSRVLRRDGAQLGADTSDVGETTCSHVTVGTGNGPFTLAELILTSTVADMAEAEAYLKAKWGTP